MKAWKSSTGSSFVNFHVIAEIKNSGSGWAHISGFRSDYTILNAKGGVTTTGGFSYEYPEFLAAGATGYLYEDGADDGVQVADFASVTTSGRYESVDGPEETFTFSNLAWKAESFGGGLSATGFLTSTADADSMAVLVLCISADGTPLGGTWTNLVQNVTAGQRKGFETVGGTAPLRASQCASTLDFATAG